MFNEAQILLEVAERTKILPQQESCLLYQGTKLELELWIFKIITVEKIKFYLLENEVMSDFLFQMFLCGPSCSLAQSPTSSRCSRSWTPTWRSTSRTTCSSLRALNPVNHQSEGHPFIIFINHMTVPQHGQNTTRTNSITEIWLSKPPLQSDQWFLLSNRGCRWFLVSNKK